ncbi:hypothetical protein [Xanthocytophaga agilis]|uniref:Uncharacterized protein n=1 Tax=Xanthocytophaga agilis TaxID=3048010 RepID=A0AAE3R6K4_9BACT|nr:hypothetical protein [Xanthocytophaga agilis]MDJ1501592.1 hypothetical protein [Xanthocytophaga agilis]
MQNRLTTKMLDWVHTQIISLTRQRIAAIQIRIDFLENQLRAGRKDILTPYHGKKAEQRLSNMEEKICSLEALLAREYYLIEEFGE